MIDTFFTSQNSLILSWITPKQKTNSTSFNLVRLQRRHSCYFWKKYCQNLFSFCFFCLLWRGPFGVNLSRSFNLYQGVRVISYLQRFLQILNTEDFNYLTTWTFWHRSLKQEKEGDHFISNRLIFTTVYTISYIEQKDENSIA